MDKYQITSNRVNLSFVIPAYNEEEGLPACLDSVFREINRNPDFEAEIIVVNNASTDKTKQVALSYNNIILVDEPKKGLVFARATGAKAATGELLAHIDADCHLPRGWVARVMAEFKNNSGLVALSGPYVYYDFTAFQNFLVKIFYWLAYGFYLLNRFILKKASMLQGGNIVVKKSAWEKIGVASSEFKFYGEDTDLARRLFKVGDVKFALGFNNSTSGRRLLKEGILKTGLRYFINYLWVVYFKKPFTKTYTDIRPA